MPLLEAVPLLALAPVVHSTSLFAHPPQERLLHFSQRLAGLRRLNTNANALTTRLMLCRHPPAQFLLALIDVAAQERVGAVIEIHYFT